MIDLFTSKLNKFQRHPTILDHVYFVDLLYSINKSYKTSFELSLAKSKAVDSLFIFRLGLAFDCIRRNAISVYSFHTAKCNAVASMHFGFVLSMSSLYMVLLDLFIFTSFSSDCNIISTKFNFPLLTAA